MPRPLKAGEPRRQVTLRLPVSAADKLKRLAKSSGISQADIIANLIGDLNADRKKPV